MIADLRPYPTYRDTGVRWLDRVPSEWEVRRQSGLVDLRVSNVDRHKVDDERAISLCDYVEVYRRDRIGSDTPFSRGTALDSEVKRFRLRRGDVLITKDSESWRDIASPALVEYEAEDLVCGYHLAILRPGPRLLGEYLLRVTQSAPVATQYQTTANGVTRFGLTQGGIKRVEIPVPPLGDQVAIASFLDHFDARIRRLIEAREATIGLAEEEKQAILNRAVNRGLDADGPLRSTDVEWLGAIPAGWEIRRLKFLARIGTQLVDPLRAELADQPLIAPNHVVAATGQLLRLETAREQGAQSGKYIVHRGELIYSKIRPALRKAVISPVDGLCSADMYPIAPRPSLIDPKYLLMVMLSEPFTRYVVDCSLRVAMPKVNREALGDAWIAYPGLAAQRELVGTVEGESTRPDATIMSARRQIALLREYRSRLISDLVTGKLDVRGAVANLPDDPDARMQLDERSAKVAAG